MTNPNPSPRDLLAQAYQDNGDLGAAGYIRSGHDLTPDTQIALLAIKDALALSQTLPAPGEVERLRAALRRCSEIVERHLYRQHEKVEDVKHIVAEALASPPAGDPVDNRHPGWTEAGHQWLDAGCPTLATVAAANDEGVAEAEPMKLCLSDAERMRAEWADLADHLGHEAAVLSVADQAEYTDFITGKPLEPWAQQAMERRDSTLAKNDEGGWKPIANAPLDGRILIGWLDSDQWQSRVAWWDAKFALDWDEDADESVDVGAWTDGAIVDFGMEQVHKYEPTHWKPTPAGPAAIRLLSQGGGK